MPASYYRPHESHCDEGRREVVFIINFKNESESAIGTARQPAQGLQLVLDRPFQRLHEQAGRGPAARVVRRRKEIVLAIHA